MLDLYSSSPFLVWGSIVGLVGVVPALIRLLVVIAWGRRL